MSYFPHTHTIVNLRNILLWHFALTESCAADAFIKKMSFNSEKKKKVQPRMEMTQMKEDVLVSEKYHRTFYNK